MQGTLTLTQDEIMLGNAAFSSKLNVIHHAYVDIAGDMIAGALLSQILYWFGADRNGRPRARIQKDGHLWIAKARGDWWQEIRITPKQYDRAAKILRDMGFIELRTMKFAGNPTTHIRIISETLNKAIEDWKREQAREHMERERQKLAAVGYLPFGNNEFDQTATPNYTDGQHGIYPMGNVDLSNAGISLTENTTENKTENKADNTHIGAGLISFDEIWGHYPKKTGRSKAQRAFDDACSKGANAFAILAETVIYNQFARNAIEREEMELRYIPTGGVWFYEERWRDETQLIGRYLGYDEGLEHNRNATRLRQLAATALKKDRQAETLELMREIIAGMPYG
jgi:hypothetical protein